MAARTPVLETVDYLVPVAQIAKLDRIDPIALAIDPVGDP
jgi:hypothetical protein